MNNVKPKHFVGLAKVIFNSSVCHIAKNDDLKLCEIYLSERILRKKSCVTWPSKAIQLVDEKIDHSATLLAENRDVTTPAEYEEALNSKTFFFDYLKKMGLGFYSQKFNQNIKFLPHHLCHATAAMAISPFEKSIIIVMDGAGTKNSDFPDSYKKETYGRLPNEIEECSIYLQNGVDIICIEKQWQLFNKSSIDNHYFSGGLGTCYEKSAEYIFNCKRSAGKVMGLAAFGKKTQIMGREKYLLNLDWNKAFKGKNRKEWEETPNFNYYADVASSVQSNFEDTLLKLVYRLKETYPDYQNLILAGGCALNCTTNMKLVNENIFDQIYIPPFPGDDGISFGLAHYLYYLDDSSRWTLTTHDIQHGYFGPISSIPTDKAVEAVFKNYKIERPSSITKHSANILNDGHIIAWFQGRSESGPRALGNRSILAKINQKGLKDHLNKRIKFREAFRPYGCSCSHEMAHKYFDVTQGFNNPYMSFATNVRSEYRDYLAEVTHVDGTSRMQTVRHGQNKMFSDLLNEYGNISGLYCLLNTSLNIMGEPIVETVEDAKNFLDKSDIFGIAIGNYFIKKKKN